MKGIKTTSIMCWGLGTKRKQRPLVKRVRFINLYGTKFKGILLLCMLQQYVSIFCLLRHWCCRMFWQKRLYAHYNNMWIMNYMPFWKDEFQVSNGSETIRQFNVFHSVAPAYITQWFSLKSFKFDYWNNIHFDPGRPNWLLNLLKRYHW